jgi:hypothetical protein
MKTVLEYLAGGFVVGLPFVMIWVYYIFTGTPIDFGG